MAEERKKRDYAFLLLIFLLLMISGLSIYYYCNPYGADGLYTVKSEAKKTKNSNLDTFQFIADTTKPLIDSIPYRFTGSTTDDTIINNVEQNTLDESSNPIKALEEIPSERFKKKELTDISTDDEVACFFDSAKKNLIFYPTKKEWKKVYLMYPSPDAKSLLRRNLLYPDFESIIYPIYKKGHIIYKGTKVSAVAVKINAAADKDRNYIIQAKSNPEYFIFGDYDDKSKWYIYENGKVKRFTPPEDFDTGINEKL